MDLFWKLLPSRDSVFAHLDHVNLFCPLLSWFTRAMPQIPGDLVVEHGVTLYTSSKCFFAGMMMMMLMLMLMLVMVVMVMMMMMMMMMMLIERYNKWL